MEYNLIEYNLNFMHPIYGTIFNADIDGDFTIQEMTENLVLSGFIAKNPAGYQLALGNQILSPNYVFAEIDGMDDSVVIRIIKNEEKVVKKAVVAPTSITVQLIHPNETLVIPIVVEKKALGKTLVEYLLQHHLVDIPLEQLSLSKNNTPIDLEKSVEDNQLQDDDYIKVIDNQKVDIVHQVQEQITNLEQQLRQELTTIKDHMPSANLIPVDPTRAVNPTQETYESIDTIVNNIRKASGQPPIKKITLIPTRTFIMIGSIFLLIIIVVLTNIL